MQMEINFYNISSSSLFRKLNSKIYKLIKTCQFYAPGCTDVNLYFLDQQKS